MARVYTMCQICASCAYTDLWVSCINSPMTKIIDYLKEGVEFVPAVVGFMVRDNQVLLGLRKKVSLGLGENLISGIGGKVGDHPEFAKENPDQALVREFQEEVGVTPTVFEKCGRVRFIFPDKPKWSQEVDIYRITKWQGVPRETESISPVWFEQNNLPKMRMWEDNVYWVPLVLRGESVEMVFLYGENNQIVEYQEN